MFDLAQNPTCPDNWNVERIVADGAVEMAIFCGPNALARARDYADHMNATESPGTAPA
jgi:hypothetical protein